MNQKIRAILLNILQPRVLIFPIAFFNFVWFYSKSSFIHDYGSTGITFCLYCPWYWDWSLTNLPSLSLLAAICLLIPSWKGYIVAFLISGYQVIQGIRFISNASGFRSGLSERLNLISELDNEVMSVWNLLDVQYLLALIIFIIASAYLVKSMIRKKQPTLHSEMLERSKEADE